MFVCFPSIAGYICLEFLGHMRLWNFAVLTQVYSMETEIDALYFIILCHLVGVKLPPLAVTWSHVSVRDLDELHEIVCLCRRGDTSAGMTRRVLEPLYDWRTLVRSLGPLRDSFFRFSRKNQVLPPEVREKIAQMNLRKNPRLVHWPAVGSQTDWDLACSYALECLAGDDLDAQEDIPHPHWPFSILPETLDGQYGHESMDACDHLEDVALSVGAPVLSRRWSRFAFDPEHMTSAVEFDFPVPQDVSQAELHMLPMYMTIGQDHTPGSGLAVDIPEWAQTFLASWNWNWTAVQCFVAAVQAGDADLQEEVVPDAPPVLLQGHATTVSSATSSNSGHRSVRPAKYGRCSACGSCRQPWVFKSGRNAGLAEFVCRRLFASQGARCFQFELMSPEQIQDLPRWYRTSHANLVNRFRRGGRADWQAPSG